MNGVLRQLPLAILAAWSLAALLAPWLPLAPDQIGLARILEIPQPAAWLGYDDLGRPVLDRLIVGARTSFIVAAAVVFLSLLVGTTIGLFSAWFGGWFDRVIVFITDVFLAFPGILLAIALAAVLGPGISNAVFALAAVGWVGFARLARAQALSVKTLDHVTAARSLGSGHWVIARRHILPLVLSPLIVQATFELAGVVIAEATLSFLGLGVQPPEASLGAMIRDGTRYMLVAPHMVVAPGLAVFIIVLSVNLLGDRLRDRMDVRFDDHKQ
ncbi:peptide/nickel transport system permease protein [Methylohalomonas lacus]|uniref:Peptide/nickel transport system permease protein n=1 Tax=Methylohalomonas lacus TaxID=398773 RepID=A0AAE3HKD4_9GAMM|nr:ABC transporter permease [Methylohalomonas lacus]MCS3903921.1 peptide/nickel transport system permease protein [Methylohalomonas lacus]